MAELSITENLLGSLEDKVTIVTGGASGIGKAIVELLAQHGAVVACGDLNKNAGEALEDSLKLSGRKAEYYEADVTDWASQRDLFSVVKQKYGRIDLVFANAGVGERNTVFDDILDSDGSLAAPNLAVIDVNLKGAIYTTKLALHHMATNNPPGGGLVMTGSTSSYNERPNLPLYSTAKHGVVGLMRAVRHRAPNSNINVGLIAPGGTVSSLFTPEAAEAFRAQGAPVNDAETVAVGAVYLASNNKMNGKALTIIGNKFTEVEDSVLRTQPLWYGEYNTDMSRRVASVRLDKLAKSD
ncbi:hypothetical protein FALBO_10044 [Fusarium albosuccineum]|uniref:Uncharacterized protein n=1 Tax=Fusarium albosuccineum TaxID=1237068 RepID=A0A8H4PIQ1_9HYPO|nr:hypothetical protein FALBO_10044 [Fusarium albosuccineum]